MSDGVVLVFAEAVAAEDLGAVCPVEGTTQKKRRRRKVMERSRARDHEIIGIPTFCLVCCDV
jgi:hypothetical protein